METQIISAKQDHSIQIALDVIRKGGLVAFPTDTVYGLGVNVFNREAIGKLFIAKGRDFNKAIAVLVGNSEQLHTVAMGIPESAMQLAARFWPGALTIVVERSKNLPDNLSLLPTVGVRMPNHPFALELLQSAGALATTSANLSGGENTVTAQEVYDQLAGKVDLIIDGGTCPGGVSSTVVDCTSPTLRVLRTGAISKDELSAWLS
jgi:L-threonylcarbamoyladenylate synthase